MSLGKKLTLGFGAIIFLVIGMCGWSYWTGTRVLDASDKALVAQTSARQAQEFSEQARLWKERIAATVTGHQKELQLLQASLLRNQSPANAFLAETPNSLREFLSYSDLEQLYLLAPGSQKVVTQLTKQQELLEREGAALQEGWRVRHEGLAPQLEGLKRTLLNWSLKTANMVFIQSSVSELVADELEETPLEEFLASPIYQEFAPQYAPLVETMKSARVTNEKLYRAIYDLDDIMMEGAWEKARLHYRDFFPPLTKSLLVDLDSLLSSENRILKAQKRGIERLNGPLSQASDDAQRLLAQLETSISSRAAGRQTAALEASQAAIAAGKAMRSEVKLAQMSTIGLTLGIVLLSMLMSWFLVRVTTRPLAQAIQMLKDLGNGKLDRRLSLRSKDEFGQMAQTMNSFADTLQHQVLTAFRCLAQGDFTFKADGLIAEPLAEANRSLNQLIDEIDASAQQVNLGSNQIHSTSQTLSEGATEQARSIEEITGHMDGISNRTQMNTERVQEANKLSSEAQGAAKHGRDQMQQMTASMAEINQAGEAISKIIKTIDEIAFQTNLLALNAAVEAARAGQHGKGFAVVAEEVRGLAARSAKAAAETAVLIEDAVTRAQRGTEIAGRTSHALDGIEETIGSLGQLIEDISSTFVQQAGGIRQTNERLQDIRRVTEQNTAHAEEAAAAAAELAGQATSLHQRISQFTLSNQFRGHHSLPHPTQSADDQLNLLSPPERVA